MSVRVGSRIGIFEFDIVVVVIIEDVLDVIDKCLDWYS